MALPQAPLTAGVSSPSRCSSLWFSFLSSSKAPSWHSGKPSTDGVPKAWWQEALKTSTETDSKALLYCLLFFVNEFKPSQLLPSLLEIPEFGYKHIHKFNHLVQLSFCMPLLLLCDMGTDIGRNEQTRLIPDSGAIQPQTAQHQNDSTLWSCQWRQAEKEAKLTRTLA